MSAALWSWLTGKIAGPLVSALAVLLAAGLAWQTARIDGLPFAGGGLTAAVAGLQKQIAARDLAEARARADALAAREKWIAAGQEQARAHLAASAATREQIQTIVRKVPIYVGEKGNAGCVVNWGAVRLLDAAASGAGLAAVSAAIAPGQPDDAASDVTLSEMVALLATDLGIARDNADQLRALEAAAQQEAPVRQEGNTGASLDGSRPYGEGQTTDPAPQDFSYTKTSVTGGPRP